jgi:hypothetical protein
MHRSPTFLSSALLCAFAASGPAARQDPAALCLDAATAASARTGVPYDVLLAITKVETGRNNRPWPWTVNFGGEGRWFDSATEAEASVAEAVGRGVTNVDLGCFQLNYRWHGAAFASIADMLDPGQNATYAAEFLAGHFEQTGDWALAAAAYHSANPELATDYQAKFEAAYSATGGEAPVEPGAMAAPARENRFPLLIAGAGGTPGSLVPAGPAGPRLIGVP